MFLVSDLCNILNLEKLLLNTQNFLNTSIYSLKNNNKLITNIE